MLVFLKKKTNIAYLVVASPFTTGWRIVPNPIFLTAPIAKAS